MQLNVLDDLRQYKLPAVKQEGRLRVPDAGPMILLFAKSGFSDALRAEAKATLRSLVIAASHE